MNLKRTLLFTIYTALIIAGISVPEVYADSILEGTPRETAGTTVYTAEVGPGQSYTTVYGVRGDNTDSELYGFVNINKGTVTGTVFGNRATNGSNFVKASFNEVHIADSNTGSVYGGYAYGGNNNASVSNNEIRINRSTVTNYVYGGYADGSTISVTGNKVFISNAQADRTVYGACAFNTESWLSMLHNEIVIENSNIKGSVYGGYASGSSTAANKNTVTIRGNSTNIRGSVYGGYALSNHSDAKNNKVIIEGGTLKNHIYGGVGRNATGNTIVIKGGDLSEADLYGYSDGRKSHSGNTLEIWTSDVKVKSAQNFENYYFLAPEDMVNNNEKYMLSPVKPVNLSGSSVAVSVQNGTTLHANDKINLIDNIEGIPASDSLDNKELKGGTLLTVYDFRLECTDDNKLIAVATSGECHGVLTDTEPPAGRAVIEANSLLGGQLASVALLNQGTESVLGTALKEAKKASEKKDGFATFLTFNGGKSDYYTDSHITINSIDLALGVSKGLTGHKTEGMFGLYFETGHGNYTTFNVFYNGSQDKTVWGNGKNGYFGGGLMLRLESSEKKGLYFDVTGHIGDVSNKWSTDDLIPEETSFDSNHLYFGTSVNTGYHIYEGKALGVNVFCNFTWTHQNSSNADIDGEQLHFNGIDSLKTKLGTIITCNVIQNIKSFLELTWEREFNGEAKATVNGFEIDSPTLKGNTGMLKLGVNCNPGNNGNWHMDLAANGYIGIRKGLSGSVIFNVNLPADIVK